MIATVSVADLLIGSQLRADLLCICKAVARLGTAHRRGEMIGAADNRRGGVNRSDRIKRLQLKYLQHFLTVKPGPLLRKMLYNLSAIETGKAVQPCVLAL